MSDARSNGVLKYEDNEGKVKVQFGDAPEFEVDIIGMMNAWTEAQSAFFDENDKFIKEKRAEFNQLPWKFVRSLMDSAMKTLPKEQQAKMVEVANKMSLWNATKFLRQIAQKSKELQDFFVESTDAAPSSQESSGTAVYLE